MPTSGHSMRAVRENDRLHDNVHSMMEQLHDPASTFHQQNESDGAYIKRVLSFTLVDIGGSCVVIERHNNLRFETICFPALPAL